MADSNIKALQGALTALGYDAGKADGLDGPKTRTAAAAYARLGRIEVRKADLPWMVEARAVFGLHEVRDNAKLRAWLKSDGKTLGDPKALPWCGDFVETAIKLGLPSEPFTGPVGENPYWARNWEKFGVPVRPTYGAIMAFVRDGGGHVGFAVGEDAECYHVLGGNQGNTVSVARLDKRRMTGCRWPSSVPLPAINLPKMSANAPKSVNEF